MKLFKKAPHVQNLKESNRLAVVHNEPEFREKIPTEAQMEIERAAKEWYFQETNTLRKLK